MNQINVCRRKALALKADYLPILASSAGCCLGIGVVGYLSAIINIALLIPSFGASCVIVSVTPDSAFAQPRNLVGGHLFSSLIGLICVNCLGTSWWAVAIAVGLSAAVMQLTQTVHPPAAADPIFFMLQPNITWHLLLTPVVLGTVVLVIFFVGYHRWLTKRVYPKNWL